MSLFRKKDPSAGPLRRACEHPAWDSIRADLEVPRASVPGVIRSAREDFVAGVEKEVVEAEEALAEAGDNLRQAIIEFVGFDNAQQSEVQAAGHPAAPPLIAVSRDLRALFKKKGGP